MKKTPKITIFFLIFVIAGTFLLAAGASAASYTVKAARGSGDWVWQPRSKAIIRGDKIVWKNPTNATHDITAYGSNWNKFAVLDPGDTTSKRFWQTGTYKYRCRLHSARPSGEPCSGMCGSITVRRRS
jgi:plastocyanin